MQNYLSKLELSLQNGDVSSNHQHGTQTEINDYLRLLFARVGEITCPDCDKPVKPNQPQTIAHHLLKSSADQKAAILFSIPLAKKGNKYLG